MKVLLIIMMLISAPAWAQKKPEQKKSDTLRMTAPKDTLSPDKNKRGTLDKMPVVKPKDSSIYSGLKEPKKDNSKYKILNATPPKKSKSEPKPEQKKQK
ncbi:hypothetical protein [Chryseobacterium gossypii]|uniref:hypothetical protein n=1 Tax=Chryseobacterium gossypii TaxID=3231602 RepID=UPI00352313D6